MIVWSVVPAKAGGNDSSVSEADEAEQETKGKTSSVAFVLVGAGVALLLLAICLSVRNKTRQPQRRAQGTASTYRLPGEQGETEDENRPNFDVPTYEDAVGSGQYPIRQSNLRNSTSQLPSYEDLIEAVENEGREPAAGTGQDPPQPGPAAEATQPASEAQPAQPARRSTRSGRLLRPLKLRRIKSDKPVLKDLHLKFHNAAPAGPITIEPLTPPPQYEDNAPEFGESLPQAEG
ncbi:hypothetical protein GJAV_G00176370 [Gymnothorax javanicus]|nr:hypothetical protein GJAV_G00176370 [Gymnothorax javanicus]